MSTYYISPTGNDTTGNGSLANPWLTLNKAYTSSAAGDTIQCAAGTYTFVTATMSTGRTLQAATGATVVFDGGAADVNWKIGGNWTITGIKFQNIAESNTVFYPIIGYTNVSGVAGTCTFTDCTFTNLTVRSDTASYCSVLGTFANSGAFVCNTCLFYNIKPVAGGVYGKLFTRDDLTVTLNGCTIAFVSLTDNFNWIGDGVVTLIIKNTIIYNGSGKTVTGAAATATYSDIYGITSPPTLGAGCITSDPLFVDAANANFRLRPTSPCLNTGTAN